MRILYCWGHCTDKGVVRRTVFDQSGDDFTAREFRAAINGDAGWTDALARNRVAWHENADANHTFSTRAWRDDVAAATLAWLRRIEGR